MSEKIYRNEPMSSGRVQEIQHRLKQMHQQTTGKNPTAQQQAKYNQMVVKEAKKNEGRR
jgi:hypothetical protein